MSKTIVLQSHKLPLPAEWLESCIDSVKHWAKTNNYEYQFYDDTLFNYISETLLEKFKNQLIIATDLARLKLMQSYIDKGYETVIWCDADFLIFSPENFHLPEEEYSLGREVWVQKSNTSEQRLVSKIKVHNAFMMFRSNNNFLDFYAETAERLLQLNQGSAPPQFIGPKLLTALHNIVQCPVTESAAMLSPLVIKDISHDGGLALKLFLEKSNHSIYAANLCNSLYQRNEISTEDIEICINKLLRQQFKLDV